jgi:guanylate kinase
MRETPNAIFSVSYTTRPPRGPEKDGVDYHFVDALTFQKKVDAGEFAEWAEVHGHFYASPKSVVDRVRASGGIAIFDIDVHGGNAIKAKYSDAVLAFIVPPSIDELERRLRDRGTDSEDTVRARILAARAEIERGLASYDYVIVNDDFDRAFLDLSSIVRAERCRRGRVELGKLKLDRSP